MPAASAASEDERRKTILSHMNRSHSRELSHYLRYYSSIPAHAASSPELCDVTLQGMRIRAHGIDYAVPFSPPLQSWDESRPRFVQMDTTAREALGVSDIYITVYRFPEGFDWVVFGAVSFYFVSVLGLPFLKPDTAPWKLLANYFPGGAEMFRWLVRILILPVLGIHFVEAYFFDARRLYRHGVPRWSLLWWKWEISCFLEGLGSWQRIDRQIARQKAEKEDDKKKR